MDRGVKLSKFDVLVWVIFFPFIFPGYLFDKWHQHKVKTCKKHEFEKWVEYDKNLGDIWYDECIYCGVDREEWDKMQKECA